MDTWSMDGTRDVARRGRTSYGHGGRFMTYTLKGTKKGGAYCR